MSRPKPATVLCFVIHGPPAVTVRRHPSANDADLDAAAAAVMTLVARGAGAAAVVAASATASTPATTSTPARGCLTPGLHPPSGGQGRIRQRRAGVASASAVAAGAPRPGGRRVWHPEHLHRPLWRTVRQAGRWWPRQACRSAGRWQKRQLWRRPPHAEAGHAASPTPTQRAVAPLQRRPPPRCGEEGGAAAITDLLLLLLAAAIGHGRPSPRRRRGTVRTARVAARAHNA